MKIKTKVNVQKEIEVEIKLPYFCKSESGFAFCKVLNEEGHNIRVETYSFSTSIEFSEFLNEGLIFAENNIEIEENEFNEAFEQALETLKNKLLWT